MLRDKTWQVASPIPEEHPVTNTVRLDFIIEVTAQEIKKQFETNFFGIFRLIKAIVPIMRNQGSGIIVNISSMVGRFGVPLNSAYVSSKFAVEGLSEAISFELEEFGILVQIIKIT